MILKSHITKSIIALMFNTAIFYTSSLYSQRESNAWIVGYGNNPNRIPKYGKTELNFKGDTLRINYNTKQNTAKTYLLNASIGDQNGDLVLFTEGLNIYGADQSIIENGDGINPGEVRNDYYPYYYPASANHVFLSSPGKINEYYLIHISMDYVKDFSDTFRTFIANKLLCTKISIDSLTKIGKVVSKNNLLLSGEFYKSHLAYCKHSNGRDWWIIIEEYNSTKHYIYLLDPEGIKLQRTQEIGKVGGLYDWSGNSIFTPDGSKFIKYSFDYSAQIFDFDRCTGELSNPIQLNSYQPSIYKEASIAVSPNSRFLYVNDYTRIWQFDLQARDIDNSIDTIGYWDGFLFDSIFTTGFYQLALADDGKIYLSCHSGNIYLHVINNPNEKGVSCNFKLRQIELPALMVGGLPFMPNFKLGAMKQSICDSLTSTSEFINKPSFTIYPNPSTGQLQISYQNSLKFGSFEIQIISISGDVIFQKKLRQDQSQWNFDLSFLDRGIYFIKFMNETGFVQTRKWLVF